MALVVAAAGLSGSGKTTALNLIGEALRVRKIEARIINTDVIPYAPQLKAIAKTFPEGHAARSMLFWVLSLEQHNLIVAAERENQTDVILVDGYWDRSRVIDGWGNGVPHSVLDWVEQFVTRRPNITFFFQAPLEVLRSRKESETTNDAAFALRIETGYRIYATSPGWILMDATKNPQDIKEYCLQVILSSLWKSQGQATKRN